MRSVSKLASAAAVAALFLAGGAPLRAAEDPSAETFRRAELAERGLGDLERAAQLYRAAAGAAASAAPRAAADLRAASCLRRLGRLDEARALLQPWTAARADVPDDLRRAAEAELAAAAGSAPVVPSAPDIAATPAAGAEELAAKERELEQVRAALESVLGRDQDAAPDRAALGERVAALARQVRDKDAELAKLRAEAVPPAPSTAEEILALRKRQRAEAQEIAQTFRKTARLLYQDGRFAEARAYLWEAIERDPEDAETKALLALVTDPLGDRAALYQRAIDLAALAHEVRAARRTFEVAHLVDEARRRQERGDFAGSSAPLETALAEIDAAPELVRGGAALRDQTLRMLQTSLSRGVPRKPAPRPAPAPDEERWSAALRELLADAGAEVAQGLQMRFHDLGAVLSSTGLPPVPFGPNPVGWTVSVAEVDGPPLLAAWIGASERRALSAPGTSVALEGTTCVLLTDLETHRRIAQRLEQLRLSAPPAAEVRIAAYRADRTAIAEALAARGIAADTLTDGCRAAQLEPADLDALLASLPQLATSAIGAASLRATPLRPFALTAGPPSSQLRIEAVAVPGARPGMGLRATVSWSPPGRTGGGVFRSSAVAGASVPPGGGFVLAGLPDPGRPAGDVTIVVRLGAAQETKISPLPPPAPLDHGADELLVPPSVARIEDPAAPPLLDPEHPVASRPDALLRRLRASAPRAGMVALRGDRVLVVGAETDRRAVANFLGRFDQSAAAARFEVHLHEIPQKAEDDLRRLCPRRYPVEGGTVEWAVLTPAETRQADLFLRTAGAALPLRDGVLVAPPTGRADAARLVRSPFTSGPGAAPGERAWGRGETSWVEEGIVVSLRPFGRRPDGRAEVDLSARARWVSDAGRREVETPFGKVPVLDPRTQSWWADVDAPLGKGESLVLLGGRSPFAATDAGHVVVVVRLAE